MGAEELIAALSRLPDRMADLVGDVRALGTKVDLLHDGAERRSAAAEHRQELLHADLRQLSDRVVKVESEMDAVRARAEDAHDRADEVQDNLGKLRKPVEDLIQAKARVAGVFVALGVVCSAVGYLAGGIPKIVAALRVVAGP